MNPLNQRLRQTFLFYSRDLLANRASRLSERQQARQQAAGVSLRLGMTIFIVIMVGTLGVIAFASLQSGTSQSLTDPELLTTLGIAGGVIGLVILLSFLFSGRSYLKAARETKIKVAEGEAQPGKIKEDAAHFEIKLGKTKIRLLTLEQLEAFEMGTAYRVYYLPGPIPTILSGEVIGTEEEANRFLEAEVSIEKDQILAAHRRTRPIGIVLAVLTIGIPLAVFAAVSLSGTLRFIVSLAVFGVSLGFVFWALRRASD
jgi:hypothetical protein